MKFNVGDLILTSFGIFLYVTKIKESKRKSQQLRIFVSYFSDNSKGNDDYSYNDLVEEIERFQWQYYPIKKV